MTRLEPTFARLRLGRVSLYLHHGALWLYYREGGQAVRRKICDPISDVGHLVSQLESQLVPISTPVPAVVNIHHPSTSPPQAPFNAIGVSDLRDQFLEYHEQVLRSSLATVRRYRSATMHLIGFIGQRSTPAQAHEINPSAFAAYLRKIEVAPNGHRKTRKRKLRDKGIQFILETCRSMYAFAVKRRHLPPNAGNPFSELPLDRMKIEDTKPIFVFDAAVELAFPAKSPDWAFPIHFTLAKTGLRVGELVHLLIEEVDLEAGWLHVRNKTELGWRVKTGNERSVPLLPEVVAVLRTAVGQRKRGPVFQRQKLTDKSAVLVGDRGELARICEERQLAAREGGSPLTRTEAQKVANRVWWDAGVIKADMVRLTFIRVMRSIGNSEATCPKSWRHSFATILQDANVDPLIRQQTLGHKPTNTNGLGMTANYTHTRGETLREQIDQALRRWPKSLQLALDFVARWK